MIRITWIRNPVWENFYITYATGYFNGNTTFSFAKSFLWSFFHSIFWEKYLSILVMIHPFTLFHSENSKKAHSILDMGAKKRGESSQVLFYVCRLLMALMTSLKESPWTFIDLILNEWNWPNFPTLGICHVQNWAWNSEFPFPKCNGRMDMFSFSICIVHSVFKEHPNYLEGF